MDLLFPMMIVMLIAIRSPLGLVLYGLWPRLARTRLLPLGSPEAAIANRKYGSGLEASGFEHLATLNQSLPLRGRWHSLDIWALSSNGVFGIVLPKAGALMFVTYFEPGPGAVVSVDYVMPAFRRPSYWRESVLGLDITALLARHLELARTFSAAEPTRPRWTDLTVEGFKRAQRGFDGGFGRPALVKKGLSIIGRLAVVSLAACGLVIGFARLSDWFGRR